MNEKKNERVFLLFCVLSILHFLNFSTFWSIHNDTSNHYHEKLLLMPCILLAECSSHLTKSFCRYYFNIHLVVLVQGFEKGRH